MSSGPIIREATLADVPALRRYAMDLFSERLPTLLNLDPDISLADEEAFVRPYLDKPGWLLLMVEDTVEEGAEGEKGAGAAGAAGVAEAIAVLSFQGREHAYLTHSGEFGISVRRDWRGRGIGTRLLDALEAWALAHGFRRLELSVFANNVDAVRLYERRGFEREGCRRGAVLIDGAFIDLIEMAKVLT